MIARRSFITGLATLIAAPAIVRAGSLMQVKATPLVLDGGLKFLRPSDFKVIEEIGDVLWKVADFPSVERIAARYQRLLA